MGARRSLSVLLLGVAFGAVSLGMACGGGGEPKQPGERITDPARVASSTPIQNPTLFKIQGNEVILAGGPSGSITPSAVSTPAGSKEHEIKSGDTCGAIASANNVTLEALTAANRNIDCGNLKIGDKLKIPGTAAATPTRGTLGGNQTVRPGSTTTGGAKSYTVKSGDTCGGIASANGTTLPALLAANPAINADCTNLKDGQVVNIP
jgi:LysM repeat protein